MGMDRERVIKGLYAHGYRDCKSCPYWGAGENGMSLCTQLAREALALLKEHEQKIGHWVDSAGDNKCSVCGATYSDLYPDYQYTHYCPNCGAEMKEETEVAIN